MVGGRPAPRFTASGVREVTAMSCDRRGRLKLFHVAATLLPGYAIGARPGRHVVHFRSATDMSLSRACRANSIRLRSGAAPAGLHDRTPWSPPRIAALVADTSATSIPRCGARNRLAARAAAAARSLNDKSSDAALFKTIETMLAGVEDPHVELSAKVRERNATLSPATA